MAMLKRASKKLKPIVSELETAREKFIETYIKPVLEKRKWTLKERMKTPTMSKFLLISPDSYEKKLYLIIDLTEDPIVVIKPLYKDRYIRKKDYQDPLFWDLEWRLGLRNPSESLEKRMDFYERKIFPEVKEGIREVGFAYS